LPIAGTAEELMGFGLIIRMPLTRCAGTCRISIGHFGNTFLERQADTCRSLFLTT